MPFSATGDAELESSRIMERFRSRYGQDIDLTLRSAYRDLLAKLGNPQDRLPPIIHVAGTNGKGSTCAFLRAILEAAGYRVHVYTSPHLTSFHERIRLAGQLISEAELSTILHECERLAEPGAVSYFEAATAAAFTAFARHPADFIILEVGLGGRLDATNVIKTSAVTAITRLSYDHRDYLGDTLTQIAHEKAGIMRPGVPCFSYPQPAPEAIAALELAAQQRGTALRLGGRDWSITPQPDGGFSFASPERSLQLPPLALPGSHQYWNAGLAIVASLALPLSIPDHAYQAAMHSVEWPARLQRLTSGQLPDLLQPGWQLWLDGGHNDSAGEALAQYLAGRSDPQPVHIVTAMLSSKHPQEFLGPLLPLAASVTTVSIAGEPLALSAAALAEQIATFSNHPPLPAASVPDAISSIQQRRAQPGLILICGSLYLAGQVLKDNKKPPQ
jgi:dihydrofolate synthase/folylpolyglutamate synthase